ncbi:DKNYY domain-containing protein, partial [Leptotrichia sp.]
HNYYGIKKKVLLADISDINKLIIGEKDLEEIFEIDDIPIKIIKEYFFSKNNIYYCGEKIEDVDLKSFEILPYGFSKDKNNLYFEGKKILENIEKFKILGENFFLINDKVYVLFFEEKARILEIDFNTLREVKIDISTIKVLGKNYISDKNNIYYANNIIENVDKNSFKILDENFSRDKNNVYYHGKKIKDVDLNSFEILSYGYSKDKNSIYYEENTFLNGSIKNLEIYNRYFFRNNGYLYLRRIFFNDTFIENLKKIKINSNIKLIKIDNYFFSFDENTILYEDFAGVHFINVENSKKFKKIKYYYYTDEKNIYYMYKKIPEVDLDSFEIINKYYSKDKNNIYFKNFKTDKYIEVDLIPRKKIFY